MRKYLAALTLLTAYAAPGFCADVESAKLVFHGVFRNAWDKPAQSEPKIDLGPVWSGPVPSVDTSMIDGKKGMYFGVLFIPSGQKSKGASVKLKYVTHFPFPGIVAPGGKPPQLSAESQIDCLMEAVCAAQYRLDDNWEIVPGTWRFEIYANDKKIVDETFKMQAAKP
ncbi:MAG: DUF3859 domain-containing protein [Burkholderiales bacterium]|nr:DUF3859 domain-containing protein [Burkholderiales bacterium]